MEGSRFFRKRGNHDSSQTMAESRLAEVIYRCLLDAMIVMDQHGDIREFNPQAERLFGYSRDEVIGRDLADVIIPEEMREAHHNGLKNYLATGEGPVINNRIEIEALRKDGSRVDIELAISADKIADQSIFVATLRDLSEEKKKQKELAQVRGYLDNVMEYGPTIFYVIRCPEPQVEQIAWISPNIRSILNFDPETIISGEVVWEQRIHPADLPQAVDHWAAAWTKGSSQLEYRVHDMSDRVRWIREACRVVNSDAGFHEIIGSIVDITESRHSERRERNLRRELDHRVKNNLQVILGECDKAITAKEIDPARIRGLASRIKSMAIVHQAMADRSWSFISLRELFKNSQDALIPENRVQAIQYKGPDLQLAVDAGMTLGAVINELIQNATKHGGLSVEGGRVNVDWGIHGVGTDAKVHLRWQETTPGVTVSKPEKKRFGLQLIESMIPYELNGDVNLEFRPEGLAFETSIPLENCHVDIGRVRGSFNQSEADS